MNSMYTKIERKLKELGINKRQLADMTKIPYSTLISAFNRKSDSFSHEYVKRIASVLGISLDELTEEPPGMTAEEFAVLEDKIMNRMEWTEEEVQLYRANVKHFLPRTLSFKPAPGLLDGLSEEDKKALVNANLDKLNDAGLDEAVRDTGKLTQIPDYQKDK